MLLELRVSSDHIELWQMPKDPIAAFRGSLAGDVSLADELISEHAVEVERDKGR